MSLEDPCPRPRLVGNAAVGVRRLVPARGPRRRWGDTALIESVYRPGRTVVRAIECHHDARRLLPNAWPVHVSSLSIDDSEADRSGETATGHCLLHRGVVAVVLVAIGE